MVSFPPILHHIRGRLVTTRLCDFEPATDQDIPVEDILALRDARAEATVCPKCQERSGIAAIHLRQDRYGSGKRSLAHMFTVPLLYRFDDVVIQQFIGVLHRNILSPYAFSNHP